MLVLSTQMVLERFDRLKSWQQGDTRAPHKPLLVLLALGELQRGNALLSFVEYENKITALLREFGPHRDTYHPEYPFWRLQRDGVWCVDLSRDVRSRESNQGDVPKTELRKANAIGRFSEDVIAALQSSPEALDALVYKMLDDNFPGSVHQDILDAVGLEAPGDTGVRRKRDRSFRERVLLAYGYRCAVCDMDLRLGSFTIGLEAAHIKWHQAHGPDSVNNGLALCSMHHKVFDLGAFTIDHDLRLLVSEKVHGTSRLDDILLRHHGQPINCTIDPADRPLVAHLRWHRREVFKEGVRYLNQPGSA